MYGWENMNKKMLMIVAATALIFGGVGVGASGLLKKGGGDDSGDSHKPRKAHKASKSHGSEGGESGHTVALDDFVVNLADSEVQHYLKSSVSLALSDPALEEQVKTSTPQLRDAILMLMSRHTYAELQKAKGKIELKESIKEKANELLGDESVTSVYFTAFAMQ
jgi:flagellar FliL protein